MANQNSSISFLNDFSDKACKFIVPIFIIAGGIKFLVVVYFDVRKYIDNQNYKYCKSKSKYLSDGINSLPGSSSEPFNRVASKIEEFNPTTQIEDTTARKDIQEVKQWKYVL